MSMGIGRPLKPVLYLEGKRVDNGFISATCSSMVGKPSTAVINLTPTNTVRHIMPRTYVHLFVNDPWSSDPEPVLLFEGEVLGTGFTRNDDGRMFTVHCADVSNYWHHVRQFWFNLSQNGGSFLDQFIRMSTGGAGRIATVGPFGAKGYLIQRMNLVADEENRFLDSMIGLLDDIGNISSWYTNARRRLRITDRVIRKNAGSVQNLFQFSFMSDWLQQLISARSGETNLLSIISLLLNIIYHEYVPVLAPPYLKADIIKRDVFGNPIRKKDGKGSLREVETEPGYTIGSFIFKPHIYTLPPPSCNVLFPNMLDSISYNRNFTDENTRMTLTPQVVEKSSLAFLKKKVFKRPVEVDQFYELVTTQVKDNTVLKKRPKEAKYGDGQGQSAYVQEFEFMTNEERFKGINPKFQGLAPAPAALSLSNQGKKGADGKRTGGVPRYMHNVASYEYFMNKFVTRTFSAGGVFNIRPVPGYPVLTVDDSDANLNFVAYLNGISHTVHASQGGSTNYVLTLPREVDEIDLNRPIVDEKTGRFEFAVDEKTGERIFDFEKMFNSEHLPPIPDWFDDSFKTVSGLTELYQQFFGTNVSSSEDVLAKGRDRETNTTFREAVKQIAEDYAKAKASKTEWQYASHYTKRAFTNIVRAFNFLGAIAEDANLEHPTEFVGYCAARAQGGTVSTGSNEAGKAVAGASDRSKTGKCFTEAEVDPTGQSTSAELTSNAIYNGKPVPHPYETKLYNDSVAKAKKANEKATAGSKARTLTSKEQAPTGANVENQTFKPVSFPLSEREIIRARRSVITRYVKELRERRGFRG